LTLSNDFELYEVTFYSSNLNTDDSTNYAVGALLENGTINLPNPFNFIGIKVIPVAKTSIFDD